jgi:hypothetical protein
MNYKNTIITFRSLTLELKPSVFIVSYIFLFMFSFSLSATKYYLYIGGVNPWGAKGDGTVTQVTDLTTTLNSLASNDSAWIAAGMYSTSGQITLKSGQIIRGGFVGTETNISSRVLYDEGGNGVVEPWEFYNATVIKGSLSSVSYSLFTSALNNSMTINGITVDGHSTSNANGGAFYFNNNSTIQNCIVRNINHTGTGGGGAIWSNTYGGVNVVGCLVENCSTSSYGGVIYANRKITCKQSVFRNNYAGIKGGALYLNGGEDTSNLSNILNNAIYNNTAEVQAGALCLVDDDAVGPLNVVNNTIVNNVALNGSTGGILGMRVGSAGSPGTLQKFYNNVIYNNYEWGTVTFGNIRTTLTSATIDLQYCAYNGGTALGAGSSFATTGDINNLSTPNFVNPSTTKGYTATLPDDVRHANFALQSSSALKDVGALVGTLSVVPIIDLMGSARPDVSSGDIGAYEYYAGAGISNLSYSAEGSTLTQNFDLLAGSSEKTFYTNDTGSDVLTALGPWDLFSVFSVNELTGWQVYKTSGTTLNGGTIIMNGAVGGNATTAFYYLGNPNSADSDVALGANSGTALHGAVGLLLQNNTGKTLTSFTLGYTGEQWKAVGSAQTLSFKYAIGSAASMNDISNGSFTAVNQLNFTTPTTGGSGATDGNTVNYRTNISHTVSGITWQNGERLVLRWDGSSGQMAIDDVSFSASSPISMLVSSTSLTGMNYTYGSGPSSEATFNVSGAGLTSGITITPPTNYEISLTSGSGFTTNAITVGAGGTIASTPIYVRLKSGVVAGSYNLGSIVVSSTGLTNRFVTCSGTVASVALNITGITGANKVYDGTTVATVTGTAAYSGLVNGESFSVTGTPVCSFASPAVGNNKSITVTGFTAPSANYILTQPAGLTASITTTTPMTVTLSSSFSTSTMSLPATSDVVVANGGTLTINSATPINSLTVAAGGKVTFDEVTPYTLTVAGDVIFKGSATTSFSAYLGAGGMSVGGNVYYDRSMDGSQWHFMSFPCDINMTNTPIKKADGTALAVGTNLFIKYYDGSSRALLTAGSNWKNMAAGSTLSKYQGYIFGLPDGQGPYDVRFPLTSALVTSEAVHDVPVTAYGDGTAVDAIHKGWNLVGQPYLSNYTGSGTNVNFLTLFSEGYYYTTYAKASVGTLPPFIAFFVQADAAIASSKVTFATASRQAVRSLASTDLSDDLKLSLSTSTRNDETHLLIDSNQSVDYQIGQDMAKWLTTDTSKPQIYSVLNGRSYAYNGLPMESVVNLPLGVYSNVSGAASISVDASNATGISQLFLTDHENGKVTDLLASPYDFTITNGTNNSRFTVSASRISTATKAVSKDIDRPVVIVVNRKLMVLTKSEGFKVQVFDLLGSVIVNKDVNGDMFEIPLSSQGAYIVSVHTIGQRWINKVIVQ